MGWVDVKLPESPKYLVEGWHELHVERARYIDRPDRILFAIEGRVLRSTATGFASTFFGYVCGLKGFGRFTAGGILGEKKVRDISDVASDLRLVAACTEALKNVQIVQEHGFRFPSKDYDVDDVILAKVESKKLRQPPGHEILVVEFGRGQR